MTNLEVVDIVLEWTGNTRESLKFVENRWGQDLKYSISAEKLRTLGWSPIHTTGLYKWF